MWLYWNDWHLINLLPRLGDVITVTEGTALLATILKEALWNMVLAAMKIKEWKEQGRKEERERQRRREEEAYERFGFEVDGILCSRGRRRYCVFCLAFSVWGRGTGF